jgi:hypothetical protein
MLGAQFQSVFGQKEMFKEGGMSLPPPGLSPEQAREFANTQMAGQQAINQQAAQQANTPPTGINFGIDYLEKELAEIKSLLKNSLNIEAKNAK